VQSLVHSKTPDSCFHRDPKHVYNERREENRKYRDREEDENDAESFIVEVAIRSQDLLHFQELVLLAEIILT